MLLWRSVVNIPPRLVTQTLLVHHQVVHRVRAVRRPRRAQVRVPVPVVVRPRPVAQVPRRAHQVRVHHRAVVLAHRVVPQVVVEESHVYPMTIALKKVIYAVTIDV